MDKKLQEIKHHFEIVLAHFDLEEWQQDFVSHLKLCTFKIFYNGILK